MPRSSWRFSSPPGVTGRCTAHLGDVYGALPVGLWLDATRVTLVAGTRVVADLKDTPVISYTMRSDFDAARNKCLFERRLHKRRVA